MPTIDEIRAALAAAQRGEGTPHATKAEAWLAWLCDEVERLSGGYVELATDCGNCGAHVEARVQMCSHEADVERERRRADEADQRVAEVTAERDAPNATNVQWMRMVAATTEAQAERDDALDRADRAERLCIAFADVHQQWMWSASEEWRAQVDALRKRQEG